MEKTKKSQRDTASLSGADFFYSVDAHRKIITLCSYKE